MDRLERLKLGTRQSHSRTTSVGTTRRGSTNTPQPAAKATRQNHRRARRKRNVILCRTQEAYTCQLSLLILLHTRSYDTLRPVHQDDSQRSIKFDCATLPRTHYRVSFEGLLLNLCYQDTIAIQLPYLNALEERLVDALQLLHSHNISFPVSAEDIEFSQRWNSDRGDIRSFKLFLPFNKKASWASDRLPPTWKVDQLSSAKSIFFVPKLLARLATSPKPTLQDHASQQALATYFRERPTLHHEKYCLGITPITAELAHQIAYNFVMRNMAKESCEILESFFGGPMPLPEPGTPPDAICRTLSDLRARAVESGEHHGINTLLYQDLEAKLLVDSPAMVTRFVCCRAKVASVLGDPDERQWWLTAMDLYDAFLSSQGPSSSLERVCAFDLNRYRDK
ncbi:hypothetical protein O1611_g103 [Lasiodiplodia mahajangana]|uniref:Uncharacterized protein n=1 Tax=Lasiodiplodia mahajangana TaxID=1108764 RepID=A0ACC2K1R6_9PEZI|nr:hypothetical protein O1611_g103 [Lasiodiplodia mahajangana]